MSKADYYISPKEFKESLQKFYDSDVLTDDLAENVKKIAYGLSYNSNFINYTYKDDMISDGIENCLTAVEKFDPERGTNPFAYYTQITFFAFVRRIQKEKKQQATKYKLLENVDIDMILAHSEGNEEFANSLIEMVRKQVDTIDPDRRTIKPGRKKKIVPEVVANFE